MVCHADDGRLLVTARLKQHVQLVCCGEGVGGLDVQSSRIPLLHVRRLARKDHGDAVGLLFDASLPQALIVKEKGRSNLVEALHSSVIVVVSTVGCQRVVVAPQRELTVFDAEGISSIELW